MSPMDSAESEFLSEIDLFLKKSNYLGKSERVSISNDGAVNNQIISFENNFVGVRLLIPCRVTEAGLSD